MRLLPQLLVLTPVLMWAPAHGAAGKGIHRCEGADGVSIYTDQPCATMDAVERNLAPPASTRSEGDRPGAASVDGGLLRTDCARRTDTLLFDLRRAIESRDVNRVAGLYHWPGARSARGVMDRLQRLADLPLAAVDLEFPESAPVRDTPEAFPPGTPVEDPIGVRVQSWLPGQVTPGPAQSLRLVRHSGCWWVSF